MRVEATPRFLNRMCVYSEPPRWRFSIHMSPAAARYEYPSNFHDGKNRDVLCFKVAVICAHFWLEIKTCSSVSVSMAASRNKTQSSSVKRRARMSSSTGFRLRRISSGYLDMKKSGFFLRIVSGRPGEAVSSRDPYYCKHIRTRARAGAHGQQLGVNPTSLKAMEHGLSQSDQYLPTFADEIGSFSL